MTDFYQDVFSPPLRIPLTPMPLGDWLNQSGCACPNCGEVDAISLVNTLETIAVTDWRDTETYRVLECLACGITWSEIFSLSRYEIETTQDEVDKLRASDLPYWTEQRG